MARQTSLPAAMASSKDALSIRFTERVPICANSLHDNLLLRDAVVDALRTETTDYGVRHVCTNIKAFNEETCTVYRRRLGHVIERNFNGVMFHLSEERPDSYQHDLVGMLHMLQKYKEALATPSCLPLHVILDGGMKSRNYLLTLFFGYQGTYSLLSQISWQVSLLTGSCIAAQLPDTGSSWCIISASDYDLVPSSLTVGASALSQLPDAADIIFFTAPVPPKTIQLMRRLNEFSPTPLSKMSTEQFWQFFSTLAVVQSSALSVNEDELRYLAEEMRRLSSKGIVCFDVHTGEMQMFKEKPSAPGLFQMLEQGLIQENIMYSAVRKEHLNQLVEIFSRAKSNCNIHADSIIDAIPFGFYGTLGQSIHSTQEQWLLDWDAMLPTTSQDDPTPRFAREDWREDGITVRNCALEFMKGKSVYVASVGENAIVGDLGEPKYYLEALRQRAFGSNNTTQESSFAIESSLRLLHQNTSGQPSAGPLRPVVRSYIEPSVVLQVDAPQNLVLYNSVITGSGKLTVVNKATGVLISNSFIHIPANKELLISEHGQNSNIELKELSCIAIESSFIGGGGVITGPANLVVGYFSGHLSTMPIVESSQEPLHVNDGEVVVTLALNQQGTTAQPTCRFPLLAVANKKNASGKRLLDEPILAGLNFFQAIRQNSAGSLSQRHEQMLDLILDYVMDDMKAKVSLPFLPENISDRFQLRYESTPQSLWSAPGRMNAGAAHTDWAFLHVMGFAIDRRTYVAASARHRLPRGDSTDGHSTIRIYSENIQRGNRSRVALISHDPEKHVHRFEHHWSNYVVGVVDGIRKKGIFIPDLDLFITGDMPQCKGLSSSAAIENAVGIAVLRCLHARIASSPSPTASPIDLVSELLTKSIMNPGVNGFESAVASNSTKELMALAQLSNEAENHFVGVGSGILDQGVSLVARMDQYTVLNCAKDKPRVHKNVTSPLRDLGYSTVVIDTGTSRQLANKGAVDITTPSYEIGASEFNRRVARYWMGVRALLPCLPFACQRSTTAKFQLTSNANPALVCSSEDLLSCASHLPPKVLLIEFRFDERTTNPSAKDLPQDVTDLPLYIKTVLIKQHRFVSVDRNNVHKTIPVICRTEYNCTAYWSYLKSNQQGIAEHDFGTFLDENRLDADQQFTYVGSIFESSLDELTDVIQPGDFVPSVLLFDVMCFMVKENERICLVADLLDGSLFNAELDHRQDRFKLASLMKEHAQLQLEKGLEHRAAFEKHVAHKLQTFEPQTFPNVDALPNHSVSGVSLSSFPIAPPERLSPMETAVIQGALGDFSWIDKRDLFRGDSPFETLETAYRFAEMLEAMLVPVLGEFVMLGKICPGAGFAGMAALYMLTSSEDGAAAASVDMLYKMITGKSRAGELITQAQFTSMGLPDGFTPYAMLPVLVANTGLSAENVDVWTTTPSDGIQQHL